jgi:hypothetical protein
MRSAITKRKPRRAGSVEWSLAIREPIEAYDEYTGAMVELVPGQVSPSSVEGLIVDFRYLAADGELTRRSVICWQCGRVAKRIYIRGYCAFREELRTFRIDRMQDVIIFRNGKPTEIEDVREFFSAFAADYTEEAAEALGVTAQDL